MRGPTSSSSTREPARLATRFVLVNTVPPDVPLEVLGRLENPVIMDWDRTHPIMRQLDFAKVTIEDAMRVRPLAAGKTLVEAVGGPLVYTLEERDRKAVFFGFDLSRTVSRCAWPSRSESKARGCTGGLDSRASRVEGHKTCPVEQG